MSASERSVLAKVFRRESRWGEARPAQASAPVDRTAGPSEMLWPVDPLGADD